MPTVRLEDNAVKLLLKYSFPGNIRQLRNITEQLSVVEESRIINELTIKKYLPKNSFKTLPVIYDDGKNIKNDF